MAVTAKTFRGAAHPTICHVVQNLEMGGMERVVESLLEGFSRHEYRMCLFCTDSEGELFSSARAVSKACGNRQSRLLTIDWKVVGALRRFVRYNGIKVLHAHNFMAQLYSVLAAVASDVRVVATVHGPAYFRTGRVYHLQKLLALITARVVCVSDDVRKMAIERRCCRSKRLVVVRNGINLDRLQKCSEAQKSSARKRLGIPEEAFVVGSVGRFAAVKNYPMLIRAFARFCKELFVVRCSLPVGNGTSAHVPPSTSHDPRSTVNVPQFTAHSSQPTSPLLLLVGDGSDRANIERAISEFGIAGSVLLPGMQDDIVPWLTAMDVFCLASITEGTSISMLEACAVGLPAVATDVGGNGEVIGNGVTGLLVPRGDEVGFAEALRKLAGDDVLRRRMGEAAGARMREKYSRENMIEQYSQLYRDVVG